MVEIPGSVTIIPAPIEQVFMSVLEELFLVILICGGILLVMRIEQWRLQRKIDAADARLRSGMTE